MNLLFIIPALVGGGAERVTVTLASELRKQYNVKIITYYREEATYDFDENIEVVCLNISDGKNIKSKLINSIKRIWKLRQIKRAENIDCTISMLASPNFENVMSRYHDKVIVSIRNKCSMQVKGLYSKINEITSKKADLTVALSRNVQQDQINYFNTPVNKIITIYNPCDYVTIRDKATVTIDDSLFWEIRNSTDFLVITAGRLIDQKGQWHLIRAFSNVVAKHPSAKLVLLGRGNLEEYLQNLIVGFGLSEHIYMLGFHNNPYPYLSNADVFAFSSLFEGFGNILLEAMACGLAIVSTDCDAGPRELLAPNTDSHRFAKEVEFEEFGVLTPTMDDVKYTHTNELTTEELMYSHALITLFEKRELLKKYRVKSSERIVDFSLEVICKQWIDIIEN